MRKGKKCSNSNEEMSIEEEEIKCSDLGERPKKVVSPLNLGTKGGRGNNRKRQPFGGRGARQMKSGKEAKEGGSKKEKEKAKCGTGGRGNGPTKKGSREEEKQTQQDNDELERLGLSWECPGKEVVPFGSGEVAAVVDEQDLGYPWDFRVGQCVGDAQGVP